MSTLIQRQEANHWYSRSGQPHYTVLRSDGEGSRPTTIADARKLGLLPSVTTIMKVLAKPAVEDWRVRRAIETTLTVADKMPYGDRWDVAQVVADELEVEMDSFKDFGNAVHAGNGYVARNCALPPALSAMGAAIAPYRATVEAFNGWREQNLSATLAVEKRVVNSQLGYAGMLDIFAEHKSLGPAILDCKRQEVRSRPTFYPEWLYQLAAYANTDDFPVRPRIISLITSANVGQTAIYEKLWTEQETQHGWEVFSALFQFWKKLKKYDPTKL